MSMSSENVVLTVQSLCHPSSLCPEGFHQAVSSMPYSLARSRHLGWEPTLTDLRVEWPLPGIA